MADSDELFGLVQGQNLTTEELIDDLNYLSGLYIDTSNHCRLAMQMTKRLEQMKIKLRNSEFQKIEPACAKFEAERTNEIPVAIATLHTSEITKIKLQNSEFQKIEPACGKFEAERTNPKFQSSPTSDNDFLNCETLSTQIQVVSESKYCQSAANGLTETVAETDLVLATVRLEITSRSVSPYGPKSELLGQELDPHGEISSMEVLNPKFQSSPASDNDFLNCETLPQGPLVSESNDCHSSANSLTRTVAETDMVFAAVRAEITSRSVSPHVGLFRRKFELHALDTGCLIRIFVTYKFRGIVTFSMELSTDVPCTVKTVSWWIIELDKYIYQKVTFTRCTISNRLIKAC